jgi:hypothetical protein
MTTIMHHNLSELPRNATFYLDSSICNAQRKMAVLKVIDDFCTQPDIQIIWLIKKRSTAYAIKQFKALYRPKQFLSMIKEDLDVHQACIQVFFTTNSETVKTDH